MMQTENPSDGAPTQEPESEGEIAFLKGSPWVIDQGRRLRWSQSDFVARHASRVRQVGDAVLHVEAKRPNMSSAQLEDLSKKLFASMVEAHGVGIAAPQIGVGLRVVVIDAAQSGIVAVNPEIEWVSSEIETKYEGCLSVAGHFGFVPRPIRARFTATDIRGRKFTAEGTDWAARCILHEIDHTRGRLYVDYLRADEVYPNEALDEIHASREDPASDTQRAAKKPSR